MRILILPALVFLVWSDATGQRIQLGVQSGLHSTFVKIKYVEMSEWEPVAYHINLVSNIPLNERFSIQAETGLGERRTFYTSFGVSHSDFRRYRILQLEYGLLGKYRFTAGPVGFYGVAGFSAGIALAGSEYRKGSAVGPIQWENTGPIDFEYFPYRKSSWGPALGFNVQYQLGPGEFVLYCRIQRAAEKYCRSCGNVQEIRFMAGIGYHHNI